MIHRPLLAVFMATLLAGCATILTETTGEEGISEDPTRRTAGTVVEDQSVETRILVNLRSREPAFRDASINVVSHNGIVLLVGQVPEESMIEQAAEIASDTSSHVRRIHNELEVSGRRGLLSRSNDTWLATKVRTQLSFNEDIQADRIRVIANDGGIFLMGIVEREEGDRAVRLARNVGGVTRVVSAFEYL